MRNFQIKVAKRGETSKKARHEAIENNQVLGNIFGDGESVAVEGPYREFFELIRNAGKNHPISIVVDDNQEFNVLIKDVERNTLTQKIHHVTFRVIKKGEKIKVDVPIHLVGEAPGVKAGLVLVHILDELEVATIPSKIPEAFEVDISNLNEDGDGVNISDLKIDEDVEVLIEDDQLIAKLETPRSQLVEEEAEAESEEGEESEGEEEKDKDTESEKEE